MSACEMEWMRDFLIKMERREPNEKDDEHVSMYDVRYIME